MIKKRVRLAQIKKNITPHSFRRSFATLLNNKGTSLTTIQKLLGHSNIETTSNYIHNDYDYLYQDYNPAKRKEYQKELMRKKRAKLLDPELNVSPRLLDPNQKLTENVSPDNLVSPSRVSPVSPRGEMLDLVSPEKVVEPVKCLRCPEIENSISNFTNLYQREQEKNKELTKEIKNSRQVIQEQSKLLTEQKQSNKNELCFHCQKYPVPDRGEAYCLKKTNHQLSEKLETINRLKEKLRSLASQNQTGEQKYTSSENQAKTQTDLNNLITKHTNFQSSQHIYSEKDRKEREFLKNLLNKLWSFAS
ncbi:13535_t:CDS:2 [Funneliformis geosporum]|uniref:13535_t:CDS:1 n=1 Tax=Funneliformis geosporum TaxID=1117311 RepID=A0A9W4SB77_9GLOM|nr:13535_t:CDS:2 [Funneliformis geosporum]